MHARFYNPQTGRFLSIDPAADSANPPAPQTWNRYAYALNSPLKYVDPDGKAAETVLDVIALGFDVVELIREPSLKNTGILLADVGLTAVPFVPTIGGVKLAGRALDAGTTALHAANTLETGVRSSKLTQQAVEHIAVRHLASSGATNAGKFLPNTSLKELKGLVSTALEKGAIKPNTQGRPGSIVEFAFDKAVGVTSKGQETNKLRVVVQDGKIITAFPVK